MKIFSEDKNEVGGIRAPQKMRASNVVTVAIVRVLRTSHGQFEITP